MRVLFIHPDLAADITHYTGVLSCGAALVHGSDAYRAVRHRLGEWLVQRTPRLYRRLGGTDPV